LTKERRAQAACERERAAPTGASSVLAEPKPWNRRNSLPAIGVKSGAPARREPGGVACAAFAEAVKAVAARPREI